MDEGDVRRLVRDLLEDDANKRHVAWALLAGMDDRIVDVVTESYGNCRIARQRTALIFLLRCHTRYSDVAFETTLRAAADRSKYVRAQVCENIALSHRPEARAVLRALSLDRDSFVREQAELQASRLERGVACSD
jgi:hypothetical protein